MTVPDAPIAALDIGSNTVRLVAALPRDHALDTLLDLSAFVRLGLGVDATGNLDPERQNRAVKAVREFTVKSKEEGADTVMAVATSAVRDAENGPAFVARVHQETGIEVEIISGEREAELTFLGATLGISLQDPVLVVDLGGGTAEVIVADASGLRWGKALPIGSGRLTERFVRHDPPHREELEAVEAYVHELLTTLPKMDATHAVYTGGTARRIPTLLGLLGAEIRLSPEGIARAIDVVLTRSTQELSKVYDIEIERAQVLAAGVAALHGIAAFYQVNDVTITQNGIRQGMIVDCLRKQGRW